MLSRYIISRLSAVLPEVIMKKKILIMIITAITVLSLTGICASAGVFGPLDFGDFGGGGDYGGGGGGATEPVPIE